MSRTYRTMAAWVVACLAVCAAPVGAVDLVMKRSDTDATITRIPLSSSRPQCVSDGADGLVVYPQPVQGSSTDGWCPQGTAPVTPEITAFSVTPTSINLGNSVSLSWTTVGVTTCTGTALVDNVGATVTGWSGTRNAQGSQFQVTPATAGVYSFRLTCANAEGVLTATSSALSVTVVDGGGTEPQCVGINPSYGLTRQTTMRNNDFLQGNDDQPYTNVNVTTFDFISGPWPARSGGGTLTPRAGQFIALKFNTGTVTPETYGGTVGAPLRTGVLATGVATSYSGVVLLAFSRCAGDFSATVPEQNPLCHFQGGQGNWTWGVGVSPGSSTCRLLENTDYYLNIAYVDYLTGTPNCTGEPVTGLNPTSCHWRVQTR